MLQSIVQSIVQSVDGFKSRWRNLYYRALGVKLHGYVWLRQIEIPRNFAEIEIEHHCAIDCGVTLLCSGASKSDLKTHTKICPRIHIPKIYIGAHTYINRHAFLDATLSLRIGQHCAIGPGCYLTDHDHGQAIGLPPLAQPMVAVPTQLGDRVWLGANVVVLKGVTIGNDVIVGAGSVVTKDLPAGAIAVGNPARVIKYRTDGAIAPAPLATG